jgi:leader peptidase (prepilin peptidase) / N-methyltransferase
VNIDVFVAAVLGVLGLLIGSFSNVLIWRLPRGENIAFPPSHCPKCEHSLAVLDLVPVMSWAALGGKCRYCKAPITPRYPIIELISGLAYLGLGLLFPFSVVGASVIGLCLLFTILLVGSVIDAETYTLPDGLTLPGVVIGLLFGLVNNSSGAASVGLPIFSEALRGALMGAGLVVTIDLLGSWIMRRLREMQYPEQPIGYQQIALGLFGGLLIGGLSGNLWAAVTGGLALGAASTLLNFSTKRVVRIPELLTVGGSLIGLPLLSTLGGPAFLGGLNGALAAAGAVSLLAGTYWWVNEKAIDQDAPADPRAMGFGDVKLAAVIGAFLGFDNLVVTLAVAVVAGAVFGIVQKVLRSDNRVKFGPFLAVGAVVALLWGGAITAAYKGMTGF